MWHFPASLLWLPTAVHAYIAFEIVQLAWDKSGNAAQGQMAPFLHILGFSLPMAIALAIGWAALSILRTRIPAPQNSSGARGPYWLAAINIAAPTLLWLGMRTLL